MTAHRMASGLPPARSADSLADSPMVTKKTSRRTSRMVVAKEMSTSKAMCAAMVKNDTSTPPTTGGGISSRPSTPMRRHSMRAELQGDQPDQQRVQVRHVPGRLGCGRHKSAAAHTQRRRPSQCGHLTVRRPTGFNRGHVSRRPHNRACVPLSCSPSQRAARRPPSGTRPGSSRARCPRLVSGRSCPTRRRGATSSARCRSVA